jgi:hypothetical protein
MITALAGSMWMIARHAKRTPHRDERKRAWLVFSAYVLTGAVIFASSAAGIFRPGLSMHFLMWIPLGLMAWASLVRGERRGDLLQEAARPVRLRAAVSIVYLALIPAVFILLKDYPAGFILGRLVPFGIPPFLSFVCAAFLSIYVLVLEKNRPSPCLSALSVSATHS